MKDKNLFMHPNKKATFTCKLWADLKCFPNKSPIPKPIKSGNNLTLFLDTSKMIHTPPLDFFTFIGVWLLTRSLCSVLS